jgi:hypothetical protein
MTGDRNPTTGQFTNGNKAAVGRARPHAAQVAKLRSALFAELTADRLRRVVNALLEQAEAGQVAAARLCLEYSIGKPVEHDLLARLEALEEDLPG